MAQGFLLRGLAVYCCPQAGRAALRAAVAATQSSGQELHPEARELLLAAARHLLNPMATPWTPRSGSVRGALRRVAEEVDDAMG